MKSGREALANHRVLLNEVSARYGVPPEVIVGIWGLESNFGGFSGVRPTIAALATLAWDPRRSTLFRGELFDALEILNRGDIELSRMRGSWAGAMGQLQFMPSSYLKFAEDYDGDGRRDIWSSPPDMLASIAQLPSGVHGWAADRPGDARSRCSPEAAGQIAGTVERRAGTCQATRDMTVALPMSDWQELGVRLPNGHALPDERRRPSLVSGASRHFLVYPQLRRPARLQLRAFVRDRCRSARLARQRGRASAGAKDRRAQDRQIAAKKKRTAGRRRRAPTIAQPRKSRSWIPSTSTAGVIVTCAQCGQKNRLAYERLGDTVRCRRARPDLSAPAAPIEVDSAADFDALIAGASLPVVVDYWAPWCGPCRMVAPELQKVAARQAGKLLVVKVNTDVLSDLGERFGIRSIPTMAVFFGRPRSRTDVRRSSGERYRGVRRTGDVKSANVDMSYSGPPVHRTSTRYRSLRARKLDPLRHFPFARVLGFETALPDRPAHEERAEALEIQRRLLRLPHRLHDGGERIRAPCR